MGFLEVLTLVFIVLKLTGTIDWSWWWVLSPIWGCLVFYVTLGLIFLGFLSTPNKRGSRF